MIVAINAVEGYDGAERGCMQLANDCNGHYLPAEWGMYPTSHLTSLQTHGTESQLVWHIFSAPARSRITHSTLSVYRKTPTFM